MEKTVEELETELKEVEKIANRQKANVASYYDVYMNPDCGVLPPFSLSIVMLDIIGRPDFDPVSDKTSSGRERGQTEKKILTGLKRIGEVVGTVCGGAMALLMAVATAPISVINLTARSAYYGISTGINKTYNKRTEKAQARVKEIKQEIATIKAKETPEMSR